MVYGYARCSTNEDQQDINRQIRELKNAGAEEVVFEYEHGDAKVKQNLNMLLDTAKPGDTIRVIEDLGVSLIFEFISPAAEEHFFFHRLRDVIEVEFHIFLLRDCFLQVQSFSGPGDFPRVASAPLYLKPIGK